MNQGEEPIDRQCGVDTIQPSYDHTVEYDKEVAMPGKNEPKQKNDEKKVGEGKSKLRDYFESLIVAIILALIVKTFVVQTFQIPTGSMEDGLLVGDHIIVNKMIYSPVLPIFSWFFPVRDIQRGDVVIFKFPLDPKIDYVKRVIGLPGERVRVYQHQVWIDGTPIEELGLDEDRYTFQWRNADRERAQKIGVDDTYDPKNDIEARRLLEFVVPEGHFFVLGDHRSVSEDSRYWLPPGEPEELRFVPKEYISGRAMIIYWSFKTETEEFYPDNFFEQIGNTIGTVITFPFKTRWERLLHIVS